MLRRLTGDPDLRALVVAWSGTVCLSWVHPASLAAGSVRDNGCRGSTVGVASFGPSTPGRTALRRTIPWALRHIASREVGDVGPSAFPPPALPRHSGTDPFMPAVLTPRSDSGLAPVVPRCRNSSGEPGGVQRLLCVRSGIAPGELRSVHVSGRLLAGGRRLQRLRVEGQQGFHPSRRIGRSLLAGGPTGGEPPPPRGTLRRSVALSLLTGQ